ncbi:MAG: hypothetical protein AVDCRST_MAG04-3154, partial [uncultured Acetobacteraceae bacterium]
WTTTTEAGGPGRGGGRMSRRRRCGCCGVRTSRRYRGRSARPRRRWRAGATRAFLAAGEASLTSRPTDG